MTSEVKRRGTKLNNGPPLTTGDYGEPELESSGGPSQNKEVKHYDADGEYIDHILWWVVE